MEDPVPKGVAAVEHVCPLLFDNHHHIFDKAVDRLIDLSRKPVSLRVPLMDTSIVTMQHTSSVVLVTNATVSSLEGLRQF